MLDIPPGKDPPERIYVHIENPKGSRVKYEYDEELGVLRFDRAIGTSNVFPTNYGSMPSTRGEDGDPLDVLLLFDEPLLPGCVVDARPIGMLDMVDEKGGDSKILAVPTGDRRYDEVKSYEDLGDYELKRIENFFSVYKDLEKPVKWTKVNGWKGPDEAKAKIMEAIERETHSMHSA